MRALKDFAVLFLVLPAIMIPVALVSTVAAGAAMLEITGTAGLEPGDAFSLAVKAWPLSLAVAVYQAAFPALVVLLFGTDLKKRFPQRWLFCLSVGTIYFAMSVLGSLFDAWAGDGSVMNVGYVAGTAFCALSAVLVAAVYGPAAWTLVDRYSPPRSDR